MSENEIAIFSGTANPKLAEAICRELKLPLGEAIVDRFPEGEVHVQILENIRGKDLFILQSTCFPSNDSLMELPRGREPSRRIMMGSPSIKRVSEIK